MNKVTEAVDTGSPLALRLTEGLGDRWKDALCPGCGEPASGLGSAGSRWLFVCSPCEGVRWGHPQTRYGDFGAAGLLNDARIQYKRAMHDDMVRRLTDA